jgi:transcription-repair coupling factor (superfamily II helicase)
VVLTERQFFPERASQAVAAASAGREPEAIIRDLARLAPGAPVVHEDHGVGRYRGLVAGCRRPCRRVPRHRIRQGRQALRAGGATAPGQPLHRRLARTAPLHSLGGEQWEKAKKKAAEKVRDVAAELLEIQAKRQARAGLALDLDRAMYEQFAAQFPFEETPDQLSAIEAVIADLGSSQPMDRVVCGDVGFGKTEVACAPPSSPPGRQAGRGAGADHAAREQHYRNFRDRFADWPMRVEVLSRFKTAKEIKAESLRARPKARST